MDSSQPMTIEEFFAHPTFRSNTKFNCSAKSGKTGQSVSLCQGEWDWGHFKESLQRRASSSDKDGLWLIHVRVEDSLLSWDDRFAAKGLSTPDVEGVVGVKVPCVAVVETSAGENAGFPEHYSVAEKLNDQDGEDYTPSTFKTLEGQNLAWRPLVNEQNQSLRAFVLAARESSASAAAAASSPLGASAAATPAPASNPFGAPATQAAAPSNPFAAVAPPTPSAVANPFAAIPAAAPANPFAALGGGGGAPAAAPAKGGGGANPFAAANPFGGGAAAATSTRKIPLEDIVFTLWSAMSLREAFEQLSAGTRCVIDDSKSKISLKFDDSESLEQALETNFIKYKMKHDASKKKKSVDEWLDAFPDAGEPELQEMWMKSKGMNSRNRLMETLKKGYFDAPKTAEDKEILSHLETVIKTALDKRTARSVEQKKLLLTLFKKQSVAPGIVEKGNSVIKKFYPSNNVCPFRPTAKLTGLTGLGEAADTHPPEYKFINPFTN